MQFDAPYISDEMQLEEEWLDYNGHLNMAFYNVLFDRGVDAIWQQLGFGPEYIKRTGHSTFSAEYHVCYLRELHMGAKVRASFQLLDHNDRSFHFYQELIHEDGWVAATGEGLGLHIDMSGPRVAKLPEENHARVKALFAAHSSLPRPARVGRQMSIRHKAGN